MKRIDLVFDLMEHALGNHETREMHAQQVMRKLGLTYKYAVPQSLYDSWWFFGVVGDVSNLLDFLKVRDFGDLRRFIGYGLSEQNIQYIECE